MNFIKNIFVVAVMLLSVVVMQVRAMDYTSYDHPGRFDPYTHHYDPDTAVYLLRGSALTDAANNALIDQQTDEYMAYEGYLAGLRTTNPERAQELESLDRKYRSKAINEFNPIGDRALADRARRESRWYNESKYWSD